MVKPHAQPFSEAFLVTLAILLALLHLIMAVSATTGQSVTSDEIAHLTAGQVYNTLGDYRLQPENGNLPQRWAALPLLLLAPHLPALNQDAWTRADVWNFGHTFFYESGNNPDLILVAGRTMIGLFGAGTGLLIFFWSRRLFGTRGAFLSLTLFAFCPNFLAHDALTTSDGAMVFFMLASVGAWWRHLQRMTPGTWALSALLFGLAGVTKYSAVLLPPMMVLMAVVRLARCAPPTPPPSPAAGTRRTRAGWIVLSALGHALVCWMVIWTFFGFRYTAFAPAAPAAVHGFNLPWEWVLPHLGATARLFGFARHWHLLPEAFLYGFAFVLDFARQRGAFLNGDYSIHGWWQFFPLAFFMKTPVALLLLLGGGLAAWGARLARAAGAWRTSLAADLSQTAPLLILFAVYWAFSLTSHLNIGHRHILPVYPTLFVLLGGFGPWLSFKKPAGLALISGLALWCVVESVRIRPHYLAYFNQIAGGPDQGYRHLVDSSLDWGQDLPGLAAWLESNNHGPGRQPVFLSYFGTGDPPYEGIAAVQLPTLPKLPASRPWYWFAPGLYCLSATMLQQVYSPIRGPWTVEDEHEYQQLRLSDPDFRSYQADPARRRELQHNIPDSHWQAAWDRFELLRFARLCHYLRARDPDAMIGYSILIYRVSQAELDATVNGSAADLRRAVEQAVQRRHPG